jgi:hypothetical protein
MVMSVKMLSKNTINMILKLWMNKEKYNNLINLRNSNIRVL